MKISKEVTSRKGNNYIVRLELTGSSIGQIEVSDFNNQVLYLGNGSRRHVGEEDFIVKAIKDVILVVEEGFNEYESLLSFENWNGVIR